MEWGISYSPFSPYLQLESEVSLKDKDPTESVSPANLLVSGSPPPWTHTGFPCWAQQFPELTWKDVGHEVGTQGCKGGSLQSPHLHFRDNHCAFICLSFARRKLLPLDDTRNPMTRTSSPAKDCFALPTQSVRPQLGYNTSFASSWLLLPDVLWCLRMISI